MLLFRMFSGVFVYSIRDIVCTGFSFVGQIRVMNID
jgi:hypothetical protein